MLKIEISQHSFLLLPPLVFIIVFGVFHMYDPPPPPPPPGGDGMEEDGHWKEFPDRIMSLMSVSMGVLPTRRTKKSCSMTAGDTVRSDGRRRRSLPKRVGCVGYWLRQYSSSAHCDFSCIVSIVCTSERPQASASTNSN